MGNTSYSTRFDKWNKNEKLFDQKDLKKDKTFKYSRWTGAIKKSIGSRNKKESIS